MVVVGAVVGWYFDRHVSAQSKPEATKQLGVLLASGMIVGEGLVGVLIAAFVAFSGKDFPLALVGDEFAEHAAVWIGGIVRADGVPAVSLDRARAVLASSSGRTRNQYFKSSASDLSEACGLGPCRPRAARRTP